MNAVASGNPLLGTWKLKSYVVTAGAGEKSTPYCEYPTGYLSYAADGRMQAIGTSSGRIVPLTFAAIPYYARIAEVSRREVDRGLIDAVRANHIDLVYCCGPLMRNLWDALSTGKRGGYADGADALESQVLAAVRAGDVIMIKGSLGSKMKPIVVALEKRFPGKLDEAV